MLKEIIYVVGFVLVLVIMIVGTKRRKTRKRRESNLKLRVE
jgi:hypothetical protein